ncbi:zf-HC2 domain-containing protein [Robertmurraya sp. P23]|uniref:zf-HC2 domain-containing protein n=1 Tax=Robertmurraya sp. P23 TaxID=3436931 RepID=UPI003D97B31E
MKFDCSLVEDLYPLYEVNELKQENRRAIEEHLSYCSNCNNLYQEGMGFSELSPFYEENEETPSKDLDDRIRLSFRLRRMKLVAGLLAAVIIVTGINQYAANREKIATLMNGMYVYSESLNIIAKNPYEIDTNRELLSYQMDDIIDLGNELGWLERIRFSDSSYHFIVNTQALDEMAANLRERKNQGLEDETDRGAVELLQKYTNTLFEHVQEEYTDFHHGYSSYFEILDVEGIATPISQIEELAYFYNKYHKLPSEMELLNEKELKEIITSAFNAHDSKIKLERNLNENESDYNFNLEDGKTEISGVINGYSGAISFATNNTNQLIDQKPKSTEELIEKANKMLKSIYGETSNFDIKPVNDGQSPNNQFWFTPIAGEYKMYFPISNPFVIEFDAETGQFFMLSAKTSLLTKEFFTKSYEEKLSQEDIENKAEQISGKKGKQMEKGIIYSAVTADYVLVYVFEGKENWIYINAETGVVERPYLPIY